MKWGVFWSLGGRWGLIAAIIARFINGDNVGCWVTGMVLRGVWGKEKCFVFDRNPEDRFFIINWDHDCFVVDINGIKGFSGSPGGPVELDVKVTTLDKGSKEVEVVFMGVYADKDDTIVSVQGEDGRGSEACIGELVVD